MMNHNNMNSPPPQVSDIILKSQENFRKIQLLEGRIQGIETGTINSTLSMKNPTVIQPPPPTIDQFNNENQVNAIPLIRAGSDTTVATIEDNIPSPSNPSMDYVELPPSSNSRPGNDHANPIIILDSSSNGSNISKSSHSMKGIIGEKRPREDDLNGNTDSMDGRPKSPKNGDHDNSPNQPENNGSRGSMPGPRQRDIKTYFTLHSQPAVVPTNPEPAVGQTLCSPANTSIYNSATQNTIPFAPAEIPAKPAAIIPPPKEVSNATAKAAKTPKDSTNKEMVNSNNELRKQLEQIKVVKDQAEMKLQRTESDLKCALEKIQFLEEKGSRLTKMVEEAYRSLALQDFRRKREKLALDSVRLGKISTIKNNINNSYMDVFEEGYATKEMNKRNSDIITRKEELELRKKKLNNLKRQAKKISTAASNNTNNNSSISLFQDDYDASFLSTITTTTTTNVTQTMLDNDIDLDLATEAEVLRAHLDQLKRDETALAEEKRLLDSEKAVHIKELKRCQCEERSRFFHHLPTLNQRYLLQSMLGRGGFSEVWKAFDLIDLREVAVKIHQLNPQWPDEKKASYIKHVTREYSIHREMKHPRVVELYDVFEIDMNSFATVLEYCKGIDLDEKLKRQKTIPEKDARAILMQIVSGLRYLSHPFSYPTLENDEETKPAGKKEGANNVTPPTVASSSGGLAATAPVVSNQKKNISIIHYDLKPANILFDEMGDAKITDFGLAKVINEAEEGTSMELTSLGAGTYWYLPPECFGNGSVPPRISSKVDVWSAGIIFYQMLYGTRPFGEGQSQESIWSQKTIVEKGKFLMFPPEQKNTPKVSDEAKELIRACLSFHYQERPDINTLSQFAYLRNNK